MRFVELQDSSKCEVHWLSRTDGLFGPSVRHHKAAPFAVALRLSDMGDCEVEESAFAELSL